LSVTIHAMGFMHSVVADRKTSAELQDFLPNFFVLREFLDVVRAQPIDRSGADFFRWFELRMGEIFIGPSVCAPDAQSCIRVVLKESYAATRRSRIQFPMTQSD